MADSVFDAITQYRNVIDGRAISQQNLSITQDVNKPGNGSGDCPYYIGDYTFPQSLIMLGGLLGSSGAQTAGTAHTHPLSTGSAVLSQNYIVAQNTAVGGYIRCRSPYIFDNFCLSAYLVTTASSGNVWLQIYREAPDGSLTQLYNTDIRTNLNGVTPGALLTFSVPLPFPVIEGERYLIRLANQTTSSLAIHSMNYESNGPAVNTMHKTTTATLATQTSFTAAEATTALAAGVLLPFIAMGQTTVYPEDRTWTDRFNRLYFGRNWIHRSNGVTGQLGITYANGEGRVTYTGTTDGIQEVLFIRPTTGDAMRADIDIADVNSNGAVDTYICRDRGSQNGVVLAVGQGAALIGTQSGGVQTIRATSTVGGEGTWTIYYEPTPDMYTVLKNGQDIGLSWIDSGHVMPHGYNYRFSSVQIERISGQNGGTIDNWEFGDWKP